MEQRRPSTDIAICSHSEETISFKLAFTFGADFADLFEVRSHKRERRGHLQEIVSSETDVAFVYTGLDGTERKTNICFQPLPSQLLASAATYQIGDIAEVWRRASVVSSWLLDLGAAALAKDPQLSGFPGFVHDSGEGRWTVAAAIEEAIPAVVLPAARDARFRSRQEHAFGERMLWAMRLGFGEGKEPIDPEPAPRSGSPTRQAAE